MATTLDGTTLPDPKYGHEGHEVRVHDVGAYHELANGSLALDYADSYRIFTLRWTGLTAAEVATIRTEFDDALDSSVLYGFPESTETTWVVAQPGSWRQSSIRAGDGVYYRDVELELVEATAGYSLGFVRTSADYVDLGSHASIMHLQDADFTVDAYWRCPAIATLDIAKRYVLVSQGDRLTNDGWGLYLHTSIPPSGYFSFTVGGSLVSVNPYASPDLIEGDWYYIRARWDAGVRRYIRIGTELEVSNTNTLTSSHNAANAFMGKWGDNTDYLQGHLCYVHIWNVDKGTLSAVPSTPFEVDGDTIARWTFSEGDGSTLGDDEGNSDGTISGADWSSNTPGDWVA